MGETEQGDGVGAVGLIGLGIYFRTYLRIPSSSYLGIHQGENARHVFSCLERCRHPVRAVMLAAEEPGARLSATLQCQL